MATTTKDANIKVRTGNKINILFGGVPVGMVQSLRASDDYSPEPASGIGDIHVQEYVPTMARHTISVQQMVVYKDTLRSLGASLENGADALKNMVFDIVVNDIGLNGDPKGMLRKYTGCSFASGELEITAHKILSASCQFNALDVTGTAA